MNPENVGRETILKVTDWLRSIWEMRRRAGPVQQWVDSIPPDTKNAADVPSEENLTPPLTLDSSREDISVKTNMTVSKPITMPSSPVITMTGVSSPNYSPVGHSRLARDPSFQSDSSRCSSVESLLELRRADPEAILLGLGFGGCSNNTQENGPLSRIPKRFLQPSKLQGITINDFVKHEQETSESLDSASLGYRGLTGSPHVAPSEIVQKIMERLREHENHEQDAYSAHNISTEPCSPIYQDTSKLSVLTPGNRQYLERSRSKSPDMRNKRMIIGQQSFAFGCDGDLIEIDRYNRDESKNSSTNGNTDNHKINNNIVVSESTLTINTETMYTDPKSSITSKLRVEKRLCKQLSIDDIAQDLDNSLDMNSPTEDFCLSRVHSSSWVSEKLLENRGGESNQEQQSDDDRTLASETPRRSSYDSCDLKKMLLARLSRENKRCYSDGSLTREKTGPPNRHRNLKRQENVSDLEAAKYCESEPSSDLAAPEDFFASGPNAEETPDNSDKPQDYETDGRTIKRSDSLSNPGTTEKPSSRDDEKTETKCDPSSSATTIEDSSKKKKDKKRHGLSVILGLHSSVKSVRMEPGF